MSLKPMVMMRILRVRESRIVGVCRRATGPETGMCKNIYMP